MIQIVNNNELKTDKIVNDDKKEIKEKPSDLEEQKQQEIKKLLQSWDDVFPE